MRKTACGEDGTSLAEMLVAILLMSMIGTITLVTTVAITGTTRRTSVQQEDSQSARVGLDAMTRVLRSATFVNTSPVTVAFVSASPTDVSFYASNMTVTGSLTNSGPTLERFYVDSSNNLVEERTPATANAAGSATPYSWPTSAKTKRVLTANVPLPQPARSGPTGAQVSASRIFWFLDKTGTAVAAGGTGTVTTAGLAAIRQVDIGLSVQTVTKPSVPATSVFSHVQIVSGYDPDGSSS